MTHRCTVRQTFIVCHNRVNPIFYKCILKPNNIANSPENYNTINPTIKENFNSKFTVSNIVGHPVFGTDPHSLRGTNPLSDYALSFKFWL